MIGIKKYKLRKGEIKTEKLNTNNFIAIKEDELEMIDGGVVGLVLAAAALNGK